MPDTATAPEKPTWKPVAAPPGQKAELPWQALIALCGELDRLFDNLWPGFGMGRRHSGVSRPPFGMTIPDITSPGPGAPLRFTPALTADSCWRGP
jgi:hypothetical protein